MRLIAYARVGKSQKGEPHAEGSVLLPISPPGRRPTGKIRKKQRHLKRMARPVGKQFLRMTLASLHQRIRPVGTAPAKMEIRAFRSS